MSVTFHGQKNADNSPRRDTRIHAIHIKVDFWQVYDAAMGENPNFERAESPMEQGSEREAHAAGIIFPIARALMPQSFLKCVHGARFDPPTGM
ncbi:hypothetical protein [Paraburkholderia oxyphila]|uniref:hypothetical protein n=1 Tax=Paraburkholderia oxyphila TaxID=614212 RepID=UPI0004873720|nr:hypothetical protein [Paraburkholderia oxyphila]